MHFILKEALLNEKAHTDFDTKAGDLECKLGPENMITSQEQLALNLSMDDELDENQNQSVQELKCGRSPHLRTPPLAANAHSPPVSGMTSATFSSLTNLVSKFQVLLF